MKKIISILVLLIGLQVYAQKPKAEAVRYNPITTTQRDALTPDSNIWFIYNSTNQRFEFYNGVSWTAVDTQINDASLLTTGTLPDARLSNNVLFKTTDTTDRIQLGDISGVGENLFIDINNAAQQITFNGYVQLSENVGLSGVVEGSGLSSLDFTGYSSFSISTNNNIAFDTNATENFTWNAEIVATRPWVASGYLPINGDGSQVTNVDAATLNQVSAKSLSWADSYMQNYRSRVLDEGATYFPNSASYSLAKDKEQNIQNNAKIVLSASATKVGALPVVKGLDLDFARNSPATYKNEDGLIKSVVANESRVSYDENGDAYIPIEPASTNLVLNSSRGTYFLTPPTETLVTSPDGTLNAYLIEPNSVNGRYEENIPAGTYTSGQLLTYTWYKKEFSPPNSTTLGGLSIGSLVNCTQVGVKEKIDSEINGFERFKAVFSVTDGSLSTNIRLFFGSVIGIGNTSLAYFGHQLELGNIATSYIKTNGTIATRVAETLSKTGLSNYINSSEGVFYFKGSFSEESVGLSISNNTNTDRINFYVLSGNLVGLVRVGNVSQAVLQTPINLFETNKIALKYKENDFALWLNGVEVATDLTGVTYPSNTLNSIGFSFGDVNSGIFKGNAIDVRVYNKALTDTQLQFLTTQN